MSQFRIYLDEDNHDRGLAAALARAGMTVFRCATEGMNGASDEAQLEFAAERRLVLYSSNVRDFERLHRERLAAGANHSGIVLRPSRRWSLGEQARRLVRLWNAVPAEDMVNRMESLSHRGEDRT